MTNSSGFGSRPTGGDGGGRTASGGQRPPQRPASRSGFVYKERSPETLKARAEQSSGRYDSIYKAGHQTWKPKQGDNLIRFLPPTWDGADHYGLNIHIHSYVGPDQGSYPCLHKMLGKPCPICRAADEARRAGDEEEHKKLSVVTRVLTWILNRDGEDPHKPLLYQMSFTQDREIAALCYGRRNNAPLWIDQPDVGYDLSFQRAGTTMKNTKYFGYQIEREHSPISNDMKVQDQILQFIQDHPLPSVLQYYPAEYLAKAILGTTAAAAVDNGGAADQLLHSVGDDYEEGVAHTPAGLEDEDSDSTPWEDDPEIPMEPRRRVQFSDRVPDDDGPPRQTMRGRPPVR